MYFTVNVMNSMNFTTGLCESCYGFEFIYFFYRLRSNPNPGLLEKSGMIAHKSERRKLVPLHYSLRMHPGNSASFSSWI